MTIDLTDIKALAFDVGGTVFDWHHTIRDEVAELATSRGVDLDAAAFTNEWRYGMFRMLRAEMDQGTPSTNADGFHRAMLDALAHQYPALELSAADRDQLNLAWHRMRAWPDAPAAIAALRERYTTIVLTVMSWSIAVDCSRLNGIAWDGILSCEFLGHYKPAPEAYLTGTRLMRLNPEEVMMVAAHPGDLRAAMKAGLRSAYVARPYEAGDTTEPDTSPMDEADISAIDFTELATTLLA